MSAAPEVSVIIPAYNAAGFIGETIRSVLAQTFTDFELIIIDDGSKDATAETVKPFLSDPRVKYVRQENAGVSAARNHGFRLSSGKYIAFLDADDVWLPENLAKKTAMLSHQEADSIALVHSYVENIDQYSKRTGFVNKGKSGHVLDALLSWDGTVVPGPSSILVRRNAVEKTGGFDTELSTAADQDFFMRLAAENQFGMIPEVLCLYRVHGTNMHQNIALMEKDHLLVYRKAEKRGAFSSAGFRRKCFSNLYLVLAGSWWVNGKNKWRSMKFMLKSVILYPANTGKLIRKLV